MLFSIVTQQTADCKNSLPKYILPVLCGCIIVGSPSSVFAGQTNQQSVDKQRTGNYNRYSLLQLKANPRLFQEYLKLLIKTKNIPRLKTVLPHYKELNSVDLLVVNDADKLLKKLPEIDVKVQAIKYKSQKKTKPSLTEKSLTLVDRKPSGSVVLDNKNLTKEMTVQDKADSTISNKADRSVRNLEKIKGNVQLFSAHINQLIARMKITELKKLLPIYRLKDGRDEFLVQYADAMILRSNGKKSDAIKIYKQMLANDASLNPVRINLAMTLLENKQYSAAKSQLLRLQGEKLPKPIQKKVARSLAKIDRSEQWNNSVSIRPIYNNNINDTPSEKHTEKAELDRVDAIKAYGIRVNANTLKRVNLTNNFYTKLSANVDAFAYHKYAKYNDYLLTVSNGWGYDDAKNDASIRPFAIKRWYGEQAYSTQYGVGLNASRWFNKKFKLAANTSYTETKNDEEKESIRDSTGFSKGLSGVYIYNPSMYFFGGISNYENDVEKSAKLTYKRNSAYIGWNKEWSRGISSSISASYSKKDYNKPQSVTDSYYKQFGGKPGSSRSDSSLSFSTKIWKRDYTIAGLTPKLSINYTNTGSNFTYYDDRKSFDSTIILNKSF